MNLFDLNTNTITMNIDGKDIWMKPSICYDKVYDRWLVSECGMVWSLHTIRLLKGKLDYNFIKGNKRRLSSRVLTVSTPKDFWEDGSGNIYRNRAVVDRKIQWHKVVMDTWAPLYDNPPEGIIWEEWEKARCLPTVYDHISKTVVIDHIDDDPINNHLNNLRRVTHWDNNNIRKAKGLK